MNIGIVTTWFERGAAYVSRQFMDVLQKTDDVYIYVRGGEKYAIGDSKWDLPNVYWGKRVDYKRLIHNSTYIERTDFTKWIKDYKIEAVLFNEQQWFTPLIWCKELGVKTIAYIDYYTEETIPLFNAYDCLICNTMRHAFAFRNHPNCIYIKWGTNLNLFRPSNVIHDKLTFFHSAGMAPIRKGTDLLIQAFYYCKDRQKSKLLIHTQVSLEEKMPNVKPLIDELLKEGTLEIVEKTISAPGLYYKGDIYVYPSRLDGIGLTLMEAAASGLAVVSIDNAPMNEFVESSFGQVCDVDYYYARKDGYYWPMSVASVPSLTVILDNYISGVYDLQDLKKHARQYAEKELNFDNNCSSLHDIISTINSTTLIDSVKKGILKYDSAAIQNFLSPYPYLFLSAQFFKKAIRRLCNCE